MSLVVISFTGNADVTNYTHTHAQDKSGIWQ